MHADEVVRMVLYSDIHYIFFVEFPTLLYEWLSKLTTQKNNFRGEPTEWTPFLIERLKRINNPVSKAVDFWIDSIIEGYITEFHVDMITSYSEAKRKFFQGPRSRYLSSWKTWIKMRICEKGILWMIDWKEKGGYVSSEPWSEMFPGLGETELESGFLRSGRRFRSGKRRKNLFGWGSCNTEQEEEGYEFASYLDEGSCDEEEEYQPISEGDEEFEESAEAPEK